MPTKLPKVSVTLTHEQLDWVNSQVKPLSNKSVVIRDLIDSAMKGVDTSCTLTERATAPQTRGAGASEVSKAVTTNKRTNNTFNKSIPPSLACHEELILAFWKTKSGAKSQAGWKLLMTELGKIQEAYDDRVVRDQLELAAAHRWKGVSLKNYEQFGLNKQPHRDLGLTMRLSTKSEQVGGHEIKNICRRHPRRSCQSSFWKKIELEDLQLWLTVDDCVKDSVTDEMWMYGCRRLLETWSDNNQSRQPIHMQILGFIYKNQNGKACLEWGIKDEM